MLTIALLCFDDLFPLREDLTDTVFGFGVGVQFGYGFGDATPQYKMITLRPIIHGCIKPISSKLATRLGRCCGGGVCVSLRLLSRTKLSFINCTFTIQVLILS